MKQKYRHLFVICAVVGLTAIFYVLAQDEDITVEKYTDISRAPDIYPDYTDLVVPSNIAPLNFEIKEPGKKYFVRLHTSADQSIEIVSGKSQIKIPLKKWRKLLRANRGKELFYDIYVMNADGTWQRYQTVSNNISNENEDIDSHLVYRRLKPNYNWWKSVGIYQRNLENFDESAVIHGESFGNGCVNCHTFLNNDPESMVFGFRGRFGSDTIMARNGSVKKLGTKFGYTTWHPSGKLITCSINKVHQFFHTAGMEIRDVVDLDSYITSYEIDTQIAKTTSGLSEKQRLETYPTWSPDGKYLYFCAAPLLWTDREKAPPDNYEKVKYDLMRISYDLETDKWGSPEMVLSAAKTGLSVLIPKISPDGRFLLFCMCNYSCFPIFQPSSDLYMMDLKTGEHTKLEINSDFSESWHSWSTNSRWIVFSSKRRGGLFTRTYISYVEPNGKVHKPFILPQKDPAFYDSVMETYSVPELVTGPIEISERKLSRVVRSKSKTKLDLPITGASSKVGASDPWQQER